LNENAFIPKNVCGSCVAKFCVLLETLHIDFEIDMIYLSSVCMSGIEYGTIWKLYATPILSVVLIILITCFLWLARLVVVYFVLSVY
jgi:hypothetical protein